MKIAVSIPDPVFAEAELLAGQMGTSRSNLYTRALAEFVDKHAPNRLTEAMDAAIAAAGEDNDPARQAAVRRVFEKIEW